jgi:ribosomal protein L18E
MRLGEWQSLQPIVVTKYSPLFTRSSGVVVAVAAVLADGVLLQEFKIAAGNINAAAKKRYLRIVGFYG